MSIETKICQNCKKEFTIEPDDFDFYEKVKVPPPTWCPQCRDVRRFTFRNGHFLYKGKCDLCGKGIISRFSSDKPYKVYCKECWWSDNWDQSRSAKEYDFSKPFFEQFKTLLLETPHIAMTGANNVNSDWVNQETDDKNCYLNVGGHFNEDSAYNTFEIKGKNCFDNYWIWQSEQCYENMNCERCWKTSFSINCFDCLGVALCSDMRNCQNCLGCSGLRNRQYYIFNKPFSKEEYEKFLAENRLGKRENLVRLRKEAEKIWMSVPKKYSQIVKCQNANGNYISESKNISNGWDVEKCEDCRNLDIVVSLKDCYDATCFGWGEFCYEIGHAGGVNRSKFSCHLFGDGQISTTASADLEYCFFTQNSNDCFGCCNVRKQQYCVLNKQYSKDDYKQLVEKIKKQMMEMPYVDKKGRVYKYGEFFPPELSPFGYNETTTNDYYPLSKQEALDRGYSWSDYESDVKYEFSDYEIPDDIGEVKDDILQKVLKCEVSGKAYRVIPMELQFYRQMDLPIPKRAPLQRHKDRMARLLPRRLFQRACQKCSKEITTPYSPDQPEIVYCEACYLKEIA